MFKLLDQVWKSLTVMFVALERVANSINNMAEVGEIHSGIIVDEARHEKAKGLAAATRELAIAKK